MENKDPEQQTTRDLQVGDFVFTFPESSDLKLDDPEYHNPENINKSVVTKIEGPRIHIDGPMVPDVLINRGDGWKMKGFESANPIHYFVSGEIPDNTRLINVVLFFLDKGWDWGWLSGNPNITFQDVLDYPKLFWHMSMVSENPNITMDDVRRHPDFNWNWDKLSDNKTVTIDDLKHFSDKNWDWNKLSKNPSISEHDIESTIDTLRWDYSSMSSNPNITDEFVFRHLDKDWGWGEFDNETAVDILRRDPSKPLNFSKLSQNNYISIGDVARNIDKGWRWNDLSENEAISIDDIVAHSNLIPLGRWDSKELSFRASLDDIIKHPHIPWHDGVLSTNPNIPLEYILKDLQSPHPRKWDVFGVSENPGITPQQIEDNLQSTNPFPWDWGSLSLNPNITPEFIEKHLDEKWNWRYLSKNSNITEEFVEEHLTEGWDYYDALSQHPNIGIMFTLGANSDKGWEWYYLIKDTPTEDIQELIDVYDEYFQGDDDGDFLTDNPNLTPEIVMKNPDFEWNWESLSGNIFGRDDQTLVKPSRR